MLQHYSLFCADNNSWHATTNQTAVQLHVYSPTAAQHADKYDAAVSVYTAYNDSHRNARKYQIDSQAPENASHFAMRITLFSSLVSKPKSVGGGRKKSASTPYLVADGLIALKQQISLSTPVETLWSRLDARHRQLDKNYVEVSVTPTSTLTCKFGFLRWKAMDLDELPTPNCYHATARKQRELIAQREANRVSSNFNVIRL